MNNKIVFLIFFYLIGFYSCIPYRIGPIQVANPDPYVGENKAQRLKEKTINQLKNNGIDTFIVFKNYYVFDLKNKDKTKQNVDYIMYTNRGKNKILYTYIKDKPGLKMYKAKVSRAYDFPQFDTIKRYFILNHLDTVKTEPKIFSDPKVISEDQSYVNIQIAFGSNKYLYNIRQLYYDTTNIKKRFTNLINKEIHINKISQ